MGRQGLIEVTDLVVDLDGTGVRAPVRKDLVIAQCRAAGDRWAERLVRELPAIDGILDEDYLDRLLVAVHGEIQRLSEEFRHGPRMWTLLEPVLDALRLTGVPGPYRVVDVGCGTGYMVRWLAAYAGPATSDVAFVGLDFNPALVAEATSLAEAEDLRCEFEVGNAFTPDEHPTVLISTGVLHHFRGSDLDRFFASHATSQAAAFIHIDFQPSALAGVGAWLFHRTRMRLGVSRHDGIRSAQRAHDRATLEAAAAHARGFETRWSRRHVTPTPFPCVLITLIGVRPEVAAHLPERFGRPVVRLEAMS